MKRKVFASGERVSLYSEKDDQVIKTSKYLYQFKDTNSGCGAKQKVERTLTFTIPKEDPDNPADLKPYNLNANEAPISKNLTASVNGHLF